MSNLFLFFALLFPRPTLLLAWLFGIMPANGTPFLADLLGAIFAPRFLIAWWLYEAQAHPFLIGLFVVFGILEFVGGGSSASRRRNKKS